MSLISLSSSRSLQSDLDPETLFHLSELSFNPVLFLGYFWVSPCVLISVIGRLRVSTSWSLSVCAVARVCRLKAPDSPFTNPNLSRIRSLIPGVSSLQWHLPAGHQNAACLWIIKNLEVLDQLSNNVDFPKSLPPMWLLRWLMWQPLGGRCHIS